MSDQVKTVLFMGMLLFTALGPLAFQPDYGATQTIVLYDSAPGSAPSEQGFSFIALGAASNQQVIDDVTVLDTTGEIGDQAGYFSNQSLHLDRQLGYTIRLDTQLLSETHTRPHRAGFSMIVISEDLLGLELAFWQDEVWVQEGGESGDLFRHAEGAAFDTTAGMTSYVLNVVGDGYTLSAGGEALLSGALRDYTAFDGFPDPYESPGLLFLGDNTGSAAAKTAISFVAVEMVVAETATASATETAAATATATADATATASATATVPPSPTGTQPPAPQPIGTPFPQATPTAKAAAKPGNRLYLWMYCLKGVDPPGEK